MKTETALGLPSEASLALRDNKQAEAVNKVLYLDPRDYPGGVAAWGALDPVFDTTRITPPPGVHIHARKTSGGEKSIDSTFDLVRVPLQATDGILEEFQINGTDATFYNIAAIFKLRMIYLRCPSCTTIHSDRGFDSVHPHAVHECECGNVFESPDACISNPVMLLKELCGDTMQDRVVIDPVDRKLLNQQSRDVGGETVRVRYQIWGSNPAILWTGSKPEEGGIHVHMFLGDPLSSDDTPTCDETYGRVEIDGINLDPEQIRYLMAQQGLDYLFPYVQPLTCPLCSSAHFDRFADAVTPHEHHTCEHCGGAFPSPEATPIAVSNPAVATLRQLRHNWEALIRETRAIHLE